MQHDLLARTEAAAMWQARAEMPAGQLQRREEQLKALQAPQEEQEIGSLELPISPAPRRLWQRLLFG
jgi:hypothetical protein